MVDHWSAALVIRVWLEDAGEFRAQLLTQRDATTGGPAEEMTVAVASSPDGVVDAVRNWLGDITRHAVDTVRSDRRGPVPGTGTPSPRHGSGAPRR